MSLDFCIGINGETATDVSFEEQPHVLIFTRFGLSEDKYPLFAKMKDYWSDTTYEFEELDSLLVEIHAIASHFSSNAQLVKQLEAIGTVCKKAKEQGHGVWVFCD